MTTFAAELRRAQEARGFTNRDLAAAVGLKSPEAISRLRWGHSAPSYETAARLANVLGDETLLSTTASLRRHSCKLCFRPFVDRTDNGNRLYCSKRCRGTVQQRVNRRARAGVGRLFKGRYREAAAAIAAFCRACEPDGVCRNAFGTAEERCPFLVADLSPFPFVPRTKEAAA